MPPCVHRVQMCGTHRCGGSVDGVEASVGPTNDRIGGRAPRGPTKWGPRAVGRADLARERVRSASCGRTTIDFTNTDATFGISNLVIPINNKQSRTSNPPIPFLSGMKSARGIENEAGGGTDQVSQCFTTCFSHHLKNLILSTPLFTFLHFLHLFHPVLDPPC